MSRQRELTAAQARRVHALESVYRLLRSVPDSIQATELRAVELETALADLRAADEPFGVAIIEIILGDLRAEWRELKRAAADAEHAERRRQEQADVRDAARQVDQLEQEGGASDLTSEAWMASVERPGGGA